MADGGINFIFQRVNLCGEFLVQLGKKFGVKGHTIQLHL